jgi:hypothetical protein
LRDEPFHGLIIEENLFRDDPLPNHSSAKVFPAKAARSAAARLPGKEAGIGTSNYNHTGGRT